MTAARARPTSMSVALDHENLQGELEKVYSESISRSEQNGDPIIYVCGMNIFKMSGGPSAGMNPGKMFETLNKYQIDSSFIEVQTLDA
jgi:hypothetical protein